MNEYYERNRRWISPFAATLVFIVVPAILSILAPGTVIIPLWLRAGLILLGAVLTGIGAKLTDTASSNFVIAIAVATGLFSIFEFLSKF